MSTISTHRTTSDTFTGAGARDESDALVGLAMLWAGPVIAFLVALFWSW